MNPDESITQILSMCPSYTYDEVKSDLSVTNSVQITVNRLLDRSMSNVGHYVVAWILSFNNVYKISFKNSKSVLKCSTDHGGKILLSF